MSKKTEPMLLTEGDKKRLRTAIAEIENAINGEKRVDQMIPLMRAQEILHSVTSWFVTREML